MDFLILRPVSPQTGYHFFEGGGPKVCAEKALLTVSLSSRCTAKGNRITSQRLLDQSHEGPYVGENATCPPPLWAFLGLFTYPTSRG